MISYGSRPNASPPYGLPDMPPTRAPFLLFLCVSQLQCRNHTANRAVWPHATSLLPLRQGGDSAPSRPGSPGALHPPIIGRRKPGHTGGRGALPSSSASPPRRKGASDPPPTVCFGEIPTLVLEPERGKAPQTAARGVNARPSHSPLPCIADTSATRAAPFTCPPVGLRPPGRRTRRSSRWPASHPRVSRRAFPDGHVGLAGLIGRGVWVGESGTSRA